MNYKIIAKYLKDLKFEISNPKIFFELTKNISNYKIKIDIKSNQFKEKIIEVETCLSLEAAKEGFDKINTKIVHCTIIELDGNITNKKELEEVILIKVPSLNDRREDVPLLVDFFTKKISETQGTPEKEFSEAAIKLLQEYDWTGNIRELRNVVERLIILGEKEISANDIKLFASK